MKILLLLFFSYFQILELEEENDTPRAQEERMLKGIHEGKRIFLHRETWRATFFLRGMRMIWIMSSLWSSTRETWPQHLKQKIAAHHVEKHCLGERARYEGGAAALLSSIFSGFLSLLVRMIAWQTQDQCIPLILAVFMMMCMSLKTVVRFLLSLDSGPAFDVVALLSFNRFISVILAYPALSSIAYDKI